MLAALASWGLRHRSTTPELRVRAELLEAGGPQLWAEFMDELRERHLGIARPDTGKPTATERLAEVYAQPVAAEA